MSELLKENTHQRKNKLEFLVQHNLIVFLILFFLALFFGLLIGYYYIGPLKSFDQTNELEKILKIDALKQQRVLDEWQQRNEDFYTADAKIYNDPFSQREIR
ncbi:MAG: hypothetical protein ACPLW9_02575 [Minisyncoccales bacterium]